MRSSTTPSSRKRSDGSARQASLRCASRPRRSSRSVKRKDVFHRTLLHSAARSVGVLIVSLGKPRSAALEATSFVAFGETERRVSPNAPALRGAQRRCLIVSLGKPRSAALRPRRSSGSVKRKCVFHRTLLHSAARSVALIVSLGKPRSAAPQATSFVGFGETEIRVSPNAPALRGAQRRFDCFARQASLRCASATSFVGFGETEMRVSPSAPALRGAQRRRGSWVVGGRSRDRQIRDQSRSSTQIVTSAAVAAGRSSRA